MHTFHCKHVKSYKLSHSLKKSRPLWPVMRDDSAPTQERRKLVKTKTYIHMCALKKRTVVAGVLGRPTPKNDEKMST